MVTSINQVRQLYVAKTLKNATTALVNTGDIVPKADKAKTILYFLSMSPAGIVSSDKIDIKNIISAKATGSNKLAHNLIRFSVTLDGNVIAGEDYILRLAFREYIGLSEEDQNYKYGQVAGIPNMTASDFYKKMALSLAKNVGGETAPLVNIYLNSAAGEGTDIPVTASTKESALNKADYNKILIEQAVQPWVLGTMPQAFIPFTPQSLSIIKDGESVLWAKIEQVDSKNKVEDGHLIADLEYFCMGARGDIYRGMGYPNIIKTTYLVDPTQKYDTLDIHYFYTGSNESVLKSEKTITLVTVDDGSHTAMKALITAINTATGLQIASL